MRFGQLIIAVLAGFLLIPANAFAIDAAVLQGSVTESSTFWFAVAGLIAGALVFRENSKRS